jgi:hypothetical protein
MAQNSGGATIGLSATTAPALWAGRVMTGLFVLFMLLDVAIKLMRLPIVEDAMIQLGYPPGLGFPIGVLEALLLVLYLIPRTAILGTVLFTGVFGGAIASHLRIGDPLLSHVLFGVDLGGFAWGGLWFRDASLRALLPLRR